MKRIAYIYSAAVLMLLMTGCTNYAYLGQKPPRNIPKVFAPGVISLPDRKEEVITFSPDLKEIYYSIEFYPDPQPSFTMAATYVNGKWSQPDTATFSKGRRTSEPFVALGGDRIYYFANQVEDQKGLLDICYSDRIGKVWSEPMSLPAPPNVHEPQFTLHPCLIADTSIYFSSFSGEICKSQYKDGHYQKAEVLDQPINHMNPAGKECWGDPFVSQDESLMIFRSNREGGYGGSDLYIVFRKHDGSWTHPQNLGLKINSSFDELGGDITPDGKYLTFGRDGDIYWVSTNFIKTMKKRAKNK
ncbi:MAG: hypothetical protein AAF206_10590 [Bacteroidota bacterium]